MYKPVSLLIISLALWLGSPGDTRSRNESPEQLLRQATSKCVGQRHKAMNGLQKLAAKDSKMRRMVVEGLMKILDTDNIPFGAWADAAELLGEVKANEAIPILVRHIDFTDGTVGLSLAHFPAVRALASIGDPALKALSESLDNPRGSARSATARAFAAIGNPDVLPALRKALERETDENAKVELRSAIARLERLKQSKND
jgi:HEAT repeat protein